MKKLILLLTFSFISLTYFAQQNTTGGERSRTIDSLLSVLKTAKQDTSKVNTLIALCERLWQTGDYEQAKKQADDALSLANSLPFGKDKGWAKGKASSACFFACS